MNTPICNPLEMREVFHLEFLRWFGRKLEAGRYVLKGGVNLRLFFKSIRYSADMDIDIKRAGLEKIKKTVMEILEACVMKNYTKITGAFGKGETSGAHLGNDVWPGRNNILYVACDEKQSKQMLACISQLRKNIGKEGIKAFVLPIDELT